MNAFVSWMGLVLAALGTGADGRWWDASVEASLDRNPERKARWVAALEACPTDQRAGFAYLIKDLPKRDLDAMAPGSLAENVTLAYQARREVSWGAGLPEEVFLDAVLPHASVTEPREPMRREFHNRYLPIVRKLKTPGEAAQALNRSLFRDYKVVYNTKRLRADQCSRESIRQGVATCTGLSIMLVEACRSVGVPARLAGIAYWPGRGGNHTWVEIWDSGWHFVGAAEPDDKGLDHAWFVAEAAKAIKGGGRSAIHAVTYRATGDVFPMDWTGTERVPGEDVTDRYAGKRPAAAGRTSSKEASPELERLLADRFSADAAKRDTARKRLAELPWDESMRAMAWAAYKASPMHEPLRRELEAKTVSTKDRTSPYLWRHVGEKPARGWALVIAMHGGGGAPKELNDSQWHAMFERYYRDHPEAGGYILLALRAPNDAWNGFYDDAIAPLIERLILQFVLFADVDPDRVFALGASHGGYGAFVIGPKIPDRFAAVHASAAAPTDGETMSENLRNLKFTVMVGDKDTAYGRADRCRSFMKRVAELRTQHGGYPGSVEILPGVGHHVPDRDILAKMVRGNARDTRPHRIIWAMSDDVLGAFYWIEAPRPSPDGRIEAAVSEKNTIELKTSHVGEVALWLDRELVDLTKPITLVRDGRPETFTIRPNPGTYCDGLERRGDPRLSAPVRIPTLQGR